MDVRTCNFSHTQFMIPRRHLGLFMCDEQASHLAVLTGVLCLQDTEGVGLIQSLNCKRLMFMPVSLGFNMYPFESPFLRL